GCFFGSLCSAIFGRNGSSSVHYQRSLDHDTRGAILQASSYSRAQLIVGRIVSGYGMGIINSTVPVFQAEFSPSRAEEFVVNPIPPYLAALLFVKTSVRSSQAELWYLLVYWIDYAFSSITSSYAWRIPVILQCFCIIPMLFIITIVPETPRWLASHDRPDESLQILARIHGTSTDDVDIKSRRRLLIACAIQSFQQLGGINAVIYYASTLFQHSIGFDAHMSSLMSGFLQTWFFLASFIPWFLIDRVGRRPLLLSMISVMAAVMAIQAALIYQVQNETAIARSAGIGAAAMLFVFSGRIYRRLPGYRLVYP
ncbi:hypothetical protein MCOR02_012456, partial [Pyricularia oryzae]